MKLQILFIVTGLFFLSCGESNNLKPENETLKSTPLFDTTQFAKSGIDTNSNAAAFSEDTAKFLHSIDTFKKFPNEIDGCSCYFSPSQQGFQRHEYLYVADFDSLAFISVDKTLIKLKLVSTTQEPETFGDTNHVKIFTSENYKVTVNVKYKKPNGDETWFNTGTITIETKEGRKTSRTFFGECGC